MGYRPLATEIDDVELAFYTGYSYQITL